MSLTTTRLANAFGILVALSLAAAAAHARPVTVSIYHVVDRKGDFDLGSPGDFYSRMTIDGSTVRSSEHSDDCVFCGYIYPWQLQLPAPWVLTQEVSDSATSVTLTIEIIDSDTPDPDNGADLNPRPDKRVLGLNVDLTTGRWTGDVNWPQNCIAGDYSEEKAVEICFDVSALSASGDADGDGLLDGWEQNGYNADGNNSVDVNLPALGANPLRKDLFVEADCVVAGNHSHCPSGAAMAQAVGSFVGAPVANPDGTSGVQLHVDLGPLLGVNTKVAVTGAGGAVGSYGDLGGGGDMIPEAGNELILSFDAPANESGTSAADLRSVFFDSQRNQVFRYALFGHQRTPAFSCFSGVSYVPGNIFLVTLGGVRGSAAGPACFGRDANGFSVGSTDEQTGAFMHELGHALGLQHDGSQPNFSYNGTVDEVHGKPNYISVMNYGFGWNFCGLPINPAGGLEFPCDYSRTQLPSLNEIALDECAGQDGGAHGLGPMNWNGAGGLQGASCPPPNTANVVADINGDGVCVGPGADGVLSTAPATGSDDRVDDTRILDGPNRSCSTTAAAGDQQITAVGQTPSQPNQLTGYDDWGNLQYGLPGLGGSAGGGSSVAAEPSLAEIESAREYHGTMAAPTVVVSKTGPATGRPGDVLNYSVEIANDGRGPAIAAVLSDIAPDGTEQVSDLGVIKLGDSLSGGSAFTVPAGACPGDYTSASATVRFRDIVGNELQASGSAPLEILDVESPVLEVSVSPSILWPSPNHKLEEVRASVKVSDNCDPSTAISLVSVSSSEPETGVIGAKDKSPDIGGVAIGTDDRAFFLRAERGTSGNAAGRVYTVTYRAVDASGNASEASALVTVPRDNSGQR